MREVEVLLGNPERPHDFRNGLISAIAAWVIDHPTEPVDNTKVFAEYLRRLREAVFAERRSSVARLCRDLVILMREEGSGLDEPRRAAAKLALAQLIERFGYEESSAADAAAVLLRERFQQMLP
jgi:hypothetical protein